MARISGCERTHTHVTTLHVHVCQPSTCPLHFSHTSLHTSPIRTSQEYVLAHFILLFFMALILAFIDSVANAVQGKLEPDDHHARRADFKRQLGFIVWSRLQNDLMVVSSCVLWAWLAHETGLLDSLAWLSVAYQSEHPSAPIGDRPTSSYWHLIGSGGWIQWMLSCHPRMPRDPTTLLHLAQDVTVALLATKALYFGFLWIW